MSETTEETMTNDTTTEELGSRLAAIMPTSGIGRRNFLRAGGIAVAGGFALAACGDDDDDDAADEPADTGDDDDDEETTTTAGEEEPPDGEGDAAAAMIAASLEVLAVNTYTAALDAATSGALGEVPPAVAEFVTTAQAHHEEYLTALNGVITSGGGEEVTAAHPELEEMIHTAFAEVTDVVGAAELALMLEGVASDTYLSVIPTLEDPAVIAAAGGIQYVTQQRRAVLLFVLGEYPVPEVFQSTENAFTG